MAVLVLVSGSDNSGKSLYAEQLIAQTKGERYYIATMIPCTEDNRQRVAKHRQQRKELGFQTLECPYQVADAPVSADSVVLLEDISNLFANVMFEKGGAAGDVYRDIHRLTTRCRMLVAVTISGLCDEGYDGETASYICGMNELNQRLFSLASTAVTMKDGQPMYEKGDVHDLI